MRKGLRPTLFVVSCVLFLAGCANNNNADRGIAPVEQVVEPTDVKVQVQPEIRPEPTKKSHLLEIMPLGGIETEDVDTVAASIRATYGWEVRVVQARRLPASAYYKPRKRYRAEKLLDWLENLKHVDADMIMGLTKEDISTTKGKHEDWGICGLAHLGGPGSVVSTFRVKRKLGKGLSPDEKQQKYFERLTDLSAHEFGHQLNLDHCPNEGCIMEDARGTVTTFNRSTGKLCNDCLEKLNQYGSSLTLSSR